MKITKRQLRRIIREALENDGSQEPKMKSPLQRGPRAAGPRPGVSWDDEWDDDQLELAIQDAENEEMDNLPYDPEFDDFYEQGDDGRYRRVYKRPRGYQDPMIREAIRGHRSPPKADLYETIMGQLAFIESQLNSSSYDEGDIFGPDGHIALLADYIDEYNEHHLDPGEERIEYPVIEPFYMNPINVARFSKKTRSRR